MRIALDAMGGDNAPDCVISGADLSKGHYPHIEMVFFGDADRIRPLLSHTNYLRDAEIIHTLKRSRPTIPRRRRFAGASRPLCG